MLTEEEAALGSGALAKKLTLRRGRSTDALKLRLEAMVRDGQLTKTDSGKYGIRENPELVSGSVLSHRDGYAFVRPDTGGKDFYLSVRDARRVFHGDKVIVKVAENSRIGKPSCDLVEVLSRAHSEIVGRYLEERGRAFIIPDNPRLNQSIIISDKNGFELQDGVVAVVKILQAPSKSSKASGIIVELLGDLMDPGMEIEIALRNHGVPHKWPDAVIEEASEVAEIFKASQFKDRKDLRNLPFVTIDGADARDFDDAVYALHSEGEHVLYVAIADVSHYVRLGSPLDAEALERGTSVYFPTQVIPMLPEKLSNGICSLMPSVDRAVLVAELHISLEGNIVRTDFYEAVICSHARLIYEEVQAWVDGDFGILGAISNAVADNLDELYKLYGTFKKVRLKRGALEIESREPKFIFDEFRKIESINSVSRVDAHKVIEECMIAANIAAAEFLLRNKEPAMFRVHDRPSDEKLSNLSTLLGTLGIEFSRMNPVQSEDFAKVLRLGRERNDRRMIETMVLRSLQLAVYSTENSGHFGLGLSSYAHFTSPIRRYPDLVVHRAIKSLLSRKRKSDELPFSITANLAADCSANERRAEAASRDVVAWLKCEYMMGRVGDLFEGVVSAITDFGMFVELDGTFIEGLVHISELPSDYYVFDSSGHVLRGRSSGTVFSIGQAVQIKVVNVSLDERKIDFSMAGEAPKKIRNTRKKKTRKGLSGRK
jgi:ribonuclease R